MLKVRIWNFLLFNQIKNVLKLLSFSTVIQLFPRCSTMSWNLTLNLSLTSTPSDPRTPHRNNVICTEHYFLAYYCSLYVFFTSLCFYKLLWFSFLTFLSHTYYKQSLDPYTEFENLGAAKNMLESVSGKYGGVGLIISGSKGMFLKAISHTSRIW